MAVNIIAHGRGPVGKRKVFIILSAVLLLLGLGVGIYLVRQRQLIKAPAYCYDDDGLCPVPTAKPSGGGTCTPSWSTNTCQFCDCSNGGWSDGQCRANCRTGSCSEAAPSCGQKDFPSSNTCDPNGGCPGSQCGATNHQINTNCAGGIITTPPPTTPQQLCVSTSIVVNPTTVQATITVNSDSSGASAAIYCTDATGNHIESTKVGSTDASVTYLGIVNGNKVYQTTLPRLTNCSYGSKLQGFALGPTDPGWNTTPACSQPIALISNPTATPIPLSTATPIPLSTHTPTPTPTTPPTGGGTIPTNTPTKTPTPTPTATPTPTHTPSPTPTPTRTPTPTPTPTPPPGVTWTPAPTPTATPVPPPGTPNTCNGTCGSDANCQSGLTCYIGYCRNPNNPSSTTCASPAGQPTNTPVPNVKNTTQLPKTGAESYTLIMGMLATALISLGFLIVRR